MKKYERQSVTTPPTSASDTLLQVRNISKDLSMMRTEWKHEFDLSADKLLDEFKYNSSNISDKTVNNKTLSKSKC